MTALEKFVALLDAPPSQEAWDAICEALDEIKGGEDLRSMIDLANTRLISWPDHLRVGKVDWVEQGEKDKLGIARVVPFFPEWNGHDALFQEMERAPFDESVFKEYRTFGLHSTTCNIFYDPEKDTLAMVETTRNHASGSENYDFVFRFDFQQQKAERLFSLPRAVNATDSLCDLLHICANGRVVASFEHRINDYAGETHLVVLQDQEVLLHFRSSASYLRQRYTPQDAGQAMFRISEDEQVVWGYYFPGNLVRIDLATLTFQVMEGIGSQVADMLPVENGLLALRFNDDFMYFGPDIADEALENQPAMQPIRAAVCTFSAINALVRAKGLDLPADTLNSFAYWMPLAESGQLQLQQYVHVCYQRTFNWEPFFFFQRIKIGNNWRVAFLAPPGFDVLVVWEFPTGLCAHLRFPDGRDDAHCYGFDSTGTEIVYQYYAQLLRWRFHLKVDHDIFMPSAFSPL